MSNFQAFLDSQAAMIALQAKFQESNNKMMREVVDVVTNEFQRSVKELAEMVKDRANQHRDINKPNVRHFRLLIKTIGLIYFSCFFRFQLRFSGKA